MKISEPFSFCAPEGRTNRARKEIIVRHSKPINVSRVALVSGALHAGLAVFFVPVLSFVFLLGSGSGAASEAGPSDKWMTLAVIAPLLCGVIGLVAGGVMASLFNLFVRQEIKARDAREYDSRFWAALRDAA
jgi:hypothetical protein